jgi:hypothetical protein
MFGYPLTSGSTRFVSRYATSAKILRTSGYQS